ncbi:MAG: vanadium-dependent haloperoxidase [Actinomycetota bacterium]|jgi:hypothetical protein
MAGYERGPEAGVFRVLAAVACAGALVVSGLTVTAASADPSRQQMAAGAGAPDASGDSIVLRWNEAAVEGIRRSSIPPTAMARGLAIVHTCIYDAWALYDGRAVPTIPAPRRPRRERRPAAQQEALSYAAYRAAVDVFPAGREEIFDPLMQSLGHDPGRPAEGGEGSPAAVGQAACAAVLEDRHRDGANQLGDEPGGRPGVPYSDYTGYRPVNRPMDLRQPFDRSSVVDLDRWQPLTYLDAAGKAVTPDFLTPQWAKVKPFALPSPDALRPATGPVRGGTPDFEAQARRLIDLSAALTDEQKVIARYWANGPRNEFAPGQWSTFAQHVARRDGHGSGARGVEQDVKLFFVLANAMADAAIASWDTKVHFDSVRPITAVRSLFAGQRIRAWAGPGRGTAEIDGAEWLPYQPPTAPTPPFAEYTAGHSTIGGAGAEALRLVTGRDDLGYSATVAAGTSGYEPGVPAQDVTLRWATFTEAAEQEGISRLYAGVHFALGDTDGQSMGRRAATLVWDKARALFAGQSAGSGTLPATG